MDSLIEDYSCPLLPNTTHAVLKGHKAAVKCITWLSDGRLASGCNDGTLRLWDASDQTCTNVIPLPTQHLYLLVFCSTLPFPSPSSPLTYPLPLHDTESHTES